MNSVNKVCFLFYFALLLSACQPKHDDGTNGNFFNFVSNPKDELVGDFALTDTGKAFIRVTKQKGNYLLSAYEHETWSPAEKMVNVKDTEFVQIFGNTWKENVEAGIHLEKGIAVFKVKKGFQFQDHTFKTGYTMAFIGRLDLYKL
jgi:hypothetical protein